GRVDAIAADQYMWCRGRGRAGGGRLDSGGGVAAGAELVREPAAGGAAIDGGSELAGWGSGGDCGGYRAGIVYRGAGGFERGEGIVRSGRGWTSGDVAPGAGCGFSRRGERGAGG